MELGIVVGMAFGASVAWVCFLSWVISQFAFKDELPARRAVLTAGTAFVTAIVTRLGTIFLLPGPLPFFPTDLRWALLAMLLYVPASFIDYLMLRRAFRKGWVDDAEPFR